MSSKLKEAGISLSEDKPLWDGPESNTPQGGVTQSLLGRFLVCRERFRIYVIEGLKANEGFKHRLEYGNMWHACEEAGKEWQIALKEYSNSLIPLYRQSQSEINKWYNCCKIQYPIYLKHYGKHGTGGTALLREYNFRVPYTLPSGRVIPLRGKWDGVDIINEHIWLVEHKTKGDPKKMQIMEQLQYDLQTMSYLIALYERLENDNSANSLLGKDHGQAVGVRYNVIRMPLSGGKGTIRRHKATSKKPQETIGHFYGRLRIIIEKDPGYFFMRFTCEVTKEERRKFCLQTLNNVLEQLCDWYEWVTSDQGRKDPFSNSIHWRHPYGIWNPMNEDKTGDLDHYLNTGDEVGLYQTETLFPELESKDA